MESYSNITAGQEDSFLRASQDPLREGAREGILFFDAAVAWELREEASPKTNPLQVKNCSISIHL